MKKTIKFCACYFLLMNIRYHPKGGKVAYYLMMVDNENTMVFSYQGRSHIFPKSKVISKNCVLVYKIRRELKQNWLCCWSKISVTVLWNWAQRFELFSFDVTLVIVKTCSHTIMLLFSFIVHKTSDFAYIKIQRSTFGKRHGGGELLHLFMSSWGYPAKNEPPEDSHIDTAAHRYHGYFLARKKNRGKDKKVDCAGRESNPGQLLGRQLCSPLYHQHLLWWSRVEKMCHSIGV